MRHPHPDQPPIPRRLNRRLWPAIVLISCVVPLLSSCGLHTGAGVIAFLRGGALWMIQSDGSSPMLIASSGVDGFAWSPDHHQLVFRYGANAYPQPPQSTLGAPDSPSNLAIVSVNGGAALQITPQDPGLLRSDAWWSPSGSRLVYREQLNASSQQPTYYVSQADQPVGIARKPVYGVVTIPTISPDGKQMATIDSGGNVRLGTPGTLGSVIASGALTSLPSANRPSRVLWQPGHNAILYPVIAPTGVSLVLRSLTAGSHTLATVPFLLDAAFSPDGSWLLVQSPGDFQLFGTTTTAAPVFTWQESDPLALPWWSPDSHNILVQDSLGWRQVTVATRTIHPLLSYSQPGTAASSTANADWHPAAASPYSPDGAQVAFVAPAGSEWLGSQLPQPKSGSTGLYVASIQGGTIGQPALIDSGADYAPGWGYLDPSSTFLVASQ